MCGEGRTRVASRIFSDPCCSNRLGSTLCLKSGGSRISARPRSDMSTVPHVRCSEFIRVSNRQAIHGIVSHEILGLGNIAKLFGGHDASSRKRIKPSGQVAQQRTSRLVAVALPFQLSFRDTARLATRWALSTALVVRVLTHGAMPQDSDLWHVQSNCFFSETSKTSASLVTSSRCAPATPATTFCPTRSPSIQPTRRSRP